VTLESGQRQVRDTPPDRVGGVEYLSTSDPFFYNCDGIRAAQTGAYWRCVAIMPPDTCNYDLRLHEVATDTKDGFGLWLAHSGFGTGGSDYVLMNFNLTERRPFDVGVRRYQGEGEYLVEVNHEYYLGENELVHGPVSLPSGDIMDLYEISLEPDIWTVRLEAVSGAVDWGLSVHAADDPYMAKGEVLYAGLAVFADAGEDESVEVEVTTEGYHAIGVWKAGAADLALDGEYILHVSRGPTIGADDVPVATGLAGVYPNPFNPQTNVSFDLANAGRVDLAVFDARGRRVATLLRGDQPVGRHRVIWRGQDDHGRRMASGVYLVRLEADGVTDLRKALMVK